jgi:DNA-directed RNA polymerase specialized sigma24 family protein
MDEQERLGRELDSFGRALVMQTVERHGLRWCRNTIEDMVQTLVIAGWEVYASTQNEGLAKNRMASRAKDLRKIHRRWNQGRVPLSSVPVPPESGTTQDHPFSQSNGDLQTIIDNDLPSYLSQRQQQMIRLKLVGFTQEDIAQELRCSTKTVEREFKDIRTLWKEDLNEY